MRYGGYGEAGRLVNLGDKNFRSAMLASFYGPHLAGLAAVPGAGFLGFDETGL
jgi:hypothetical protein